jgi:hypothetical protein
VRTLARVLNDAGYQVCEAGRGSNGSLGEPMELIMTDLRCPR